MPVCWQCKRGPCVQPLVLPGRVQADAFLAHYIDDSPSERGHQRSERVEDGSAYTEPSNETGTDIVRSVHCGAKEPNSASGTRSTVAIIAQRDVDLLACLRLGEPRMVAVGASPASGPRERPSPNPGGRGAP